MIELPSFSIKWIQNLTIYQTVTRIIIVGSNNAKSRFRLLQIDRTFQNDLHFYTDETDYDKYEIEERLGVLLSKLGSSGKRKNFSQPLKAYGIVGFVKFLEGYYLILLTKRRQVAEIGGHSIYKIEDTATIYVPSVESSNPDENRYVKIFQAVDLSSNFYYSYSYDLTNTLQHNMLKLKSAPKFYQNLSSGSDKHKRENEMAKQREMSTMTGLVSNHDLHKDWKGANDEPCSVCGTTRSAADDCVEEKFLWNCYLQEKMHSGKVNRLWCLDVMHGYINQSCINIFGERIYITIIGRRSNKFAGPRFLKRGCNLKGEVANEVETEQIVHRASVSSLHHTPYTSFVQHRGSVPVHWKQDITANVVPAKPPICLTSDNSYAQATGKHFNEMMTRYGTPITVLNLVKKRDKKANESMLGKEFKIAVEYLNQFVRTKHQIKYHALDMAHLLRGTKQNVLARLADIAEASLHSTGFFHSQPDLVLPDGRREDPKWQKVGGATVDGYRVQTGVLRTNCVDCLDRTNSAQFVASKCALAYQLYSLGVVHRLDLQFDTEAMRMFEEMFEEHGDIIALQYGGSLLVHTIQSYRRLANPWSTHSRDIVTTLSRYYSNTFSDADKQSAINLFLGVFRVAPQSCHLWEMGSDEQLHNGADLALASFAASSSCAYTKWWEERLAAVLPLPSSIAKIIEAKRAAASHVGKDSRGLFRCMDCCDWFVDFHRLDELTSFDDCFSINLPNTAARCEIAGYEDANPFTVRLSRQAKDQQNAVDSKNLSKLKEEDSDDSDWFESSDESASESNESPQPVTCESGGDVIDLDSAPWLRKPTLEDFSPKKVYGIELKVDEEDLKLYERHVSCSNFEQNFSHLKEDRDCAEVFCAEPKVDEESMKIYRDCLEYKLHVDKQFYRDYLRKFTYVQLD